MLKQGSALYFVQSPSSNSDRAFSVSGNVDLLRLVSALVPDSHAHDLLVGTCLDSTVRYALFCPHDDSTSKEKYIMKRF